MTDSSEPFFLLGAVRSGTTMLRLMLGHHPEICRCEEFDFSVEALGKSRTLPTLVSFQEALQLHRGFRQSGYVIDRSLDHFALLRSFLETRRRTDGCPRVCATVHSSFIRLHEIWPCAKFIYLRRDPRDVSRSIVAMGWAGNTWHGSRRWAEVEQEWRRLTNCVSPDRLYEVRFEELVADPEAILRRICAFLDIRYNSLMLEIDRDTTYSRPGKKAAKSWRDDSTQIEIQLAEAAASDLLMSAGYEHSALPPLHLSSVRRLSLTLQDRAYRIRFAIRRYGFGLWISGVIARRLPLKSMRHAVEDRIQDIMNRHMK